ncbi:uncharacterized protein LOC143859515 [Tasmannia lanceolata]|uniref:uncharacterized protein LOC143859515 n=1 Tax=Tasmannia lanceolata TaxID=3420 RepID=UPI0040643627
MDANPTYNIQALKEENYLDESAMAVIRDKYCIPPRFFYVEDAESSEPWPVPLKWGTPDTVAMSRKPFLEGEDARTLALLREVLDWEGPADCSDFQGEEKRKAPETASPAPTQDAPPLPKAKSSVKLVSSSGRGAGSSRTVATSAGTLPPPARSGDNLFWPNWAVQKTDSGLGESRVAVEIQTKCILDKDKQQVLHEPPATAEEAVFSSLYQIGVYFNDLRGKSKKFSDAITKSEGENGKLKREAKELKKSVEKSADEIKRLREDFVAQLAAQKEEATEALNAQRERALSRQATAVQEKEDELLLLSSEAYKIGFFDCLGQVKDSNPGVDLSRMVIPDPPTLTGEEPAAADALLPPGADSARDGGNEAP